MLFDIISMLYGRGRVTGVPPGLQNLCWALRTSWVGSIPTHVRQKESSMIFMVPKKASW